MTTAVDVSRPTDALREIQRGRVVQAAVRQNTEVEAYPLWNSQPAGEVAKERRDVFRTPRGEQRSGDSVEDRLKSVREVTRCRPCSTKQQ